MSSSASSVSDFSASAATWWSLFLLVPLAIWYTQKRPALPSPERLSAVGAGGQKKKNRKGGSSKARDNSTALSPLPAAEAAPASTSAHTSPNESAQIQSKTAKKKQRKKNKAAAEPTPTLPGSFDSPPSNSIPLHSTSWTDAPDTAPPQAKSSKRRSKQSLTEAVSSVDPPRGSSSGVSPLPPSPTPSSSPPRPAKELPTQDSVSDTPPSPLMEVNAPASEPASKTREPEWASVPTRSVRSQQSALAFKSGDASLSRFSSQNAFSLLPEEGDRERANIDGSARVVRLASTVPSAGSGSSHGGSRLRSAPTSEPTKKQRQNAAKREAAKLAREEAEEERKAALAAHRRTRTTPHAPSLKRASGFASAASKGGTLDQATLLSLSQGSRKQPSGGQRAQVDAHGHLVWN